MVYNLNMYNPGLNIVFLGPPVSTAVDVKPVPQDLQAIVLSDIDSIRFARA